MKLRVIMNCTNHNKPLEIFCETCQYMICQNCTVRHHRDHDCDIVTDKHRQNIESALQQVKQKIKATNNVLTDLSRRDKEVTEQGDNVIKEIHQFSTDH